MHKTRENISLSKYLWTVQYDVIMAVHQAAQGLLRYAYALYIAFLWQTLSLHIPSSTKNIKISAIKLFSTPTNCILHLKSQIKMPHTALAPEVGKVC